MRVLIAFLVLWGIASANDKLDSLIKVTIDIGDSLQKGVNYCDSNSTEGEKSKTQLFSSMTTCISKETKADTAIIHSLFGIVTEITVLADVTWNGYCKEDWLKNYTGDTSGKYSKDEDSFTYIIKRGNMNYILTCYLDVMTLELTKYMETTIQLEDFAKIIIPVSKDKDPALNFKNYWEFVVSDYLKINKSKNEVQAKIFKNISDKDKFISMGVEDVKYYLKIQKDISYATKK